MKNVRIKLCFLCCASSSFASEYGVPKPPIQLDCRESFFGVPFEGETSYFAVEDSVVRNGSGSAPAFSYTTAEYSHWNSNEGEGLFCAGGDHSLSVTFYGKKAEEIYNQLAVPERVTPEQDSFYYRKFKVLNVDGTFNDPSSPSLIYCGKYFGCKQEWIPPTPDTVNQYPSGHTVCHPVPDFRTSCTVSIKPATDAKNMILPKVFPSEATLSQSVNNDQPAARVTENGFVRTFEGIFRGAPAKALKKALRGKNIHEEYISEFLSGNENGGYSSLKCGMDPAYGEETCRIKVHRNQITYPGGHPGPEF